MTLALAWFGFAVLLWRLVPRSFDEFSSRRPAAAPASDNAELPLVSIIVPARNEAANLPTILDSLQLLTYPNVEIIVVDDHSTDETSAVAGRYGVQVITAADKPEHWAGKTWACWQGVEVAKGDYLLFTDADTLHLPNSLHEGIRFMRENRLDLLSSPPFHRTRRFWETLLGPFHLLLLLATAPYGRPTPKRVFAIGQYLLFRTDAYRRMGGHKAVRGTLAEDLAFAEMCLTADGAYAVYMERPLYQVRMYETFAEFVAGWRRIIRWGMERGSFLGTLEVVLAMFAILGAGKLFSGGAYLGVALLSLGYIGGIQRRWGEFSFWGVVLFPFAISIFCAVTLLATADRLFRRPSLWRGRAYRAGIN